MQSRCHHRGNVFFVNGWHRSRYDECHATLITHTRLSLSPLGSITITVLVRPKVVLTTFVIIIESNLFRAKLGILWLIAMDVVPSVIISA